MVLKLPAPYFERLRVDDHDDFERISEAIKQVFLSLNLPKFDLIVPQNGAKESVHRVVLYPNCDKDFIGLSEKEFNMVRDFIGAAPKQLLKITLRLGNRKALSEEKVSHDVIMSQMVPFIVIEFMDRHQIKMAGGVFYEIKNTFGKEIESILMEALSCMDVSPINQQVASRCADLANRFTRDVPKFRKISLTPRHKRDKSDPLYRPQRERADSSLYWDLGGDGEEPVYMSDGVWVNPDGTCDCD